MANFAIFDKLSFGLTSYPLVCKKHVAKCLDKIRNKTAEKAKEVEHGEGFLITRSGQRPIGG